VKGVHVSAVRVHEKLDLVLHRVSMHRVVIDPDDFVAIAGQLTCEVGAERAEADDAKAHKCQGLK
jgi:hypothetical protein